MMTVLSTLRTGDMVLAMNDVYGGTDRLLSKVAVPQWGFRYAQVDMGDVLAVQKMIDENGGAVRMLWVETPSNPTLKLVDIAALCEAVKKLDPTIVIVIDNTFATPYLQKPLRLGADVVVHSVTKYIGGHSDVLMGAVVCNSENFAEQLAFLQKAIGAVPSPFDCFLALRGLKTLGLRMRQHCETAVKVAAYLSKHEHVNRVYYPGFKDHPKHDVAVKQMIGGFGGMLSFELRDGDLEKTVKLTKAVRLFALAESLGGVESLIEVPSVMTHACIAANVREHLGITDSLIRLSIGCESAQDLILDLDEALKVAFS